MANSIVTEEKAVIVAAHLKAAVPVSSVVTSKFESSYEGGGGDTVSVKCVDYGAVYDSKDGDMSGVDKDTASIKTPIQVNYKTNIVELSAKDDQLNLEDFSVQVVQPRISLLASKVSKSIIEAVARAASYQIVMPQMTDVSYGVLSDAIALVEDSRVGDKITGVISNSVKAAITTKGANQFGPNTSIGEKLFRNKMNEYGGIGWIPTADALKIKNAQQIAGAKLAEPIANGSMGIRITFAGSGVLAKHTPFTIKGVNAVDAYGEDMSRERCFVVSKDTPFASGQTVSVPVAPVWHQRTDGGFKNTSSAGETGLDVLFPLDQKTYSVVCVFADKAAGLASLKPAPLKGGGVETAASSVDAINVLMTAQADATKFKSMHRWDVLIGAEPIYQQGACNIYVPVN